MKLKKKRAQLNKLHKLRNIYNYHVYLIISEDIDNLNKAIRRQLRQKFVIEDNQPDSSSTYIIQPNFIIIRMPHWFGDNPDVALLGHEIVHVVFELLADAEVRYTRENNEAFTYCFADLFVQALDILIKDKTA